MISVEEYIKIEDKIMGDMALVDGVLSLEHDYYLVLTPELYKIIDTYSAKTYGRNDLGHKISFCDYPIFIADEELCNHFWNKEFYGLIPFKRYNGHRVIGSDDFKNIHKYKKIVWLEELTKQIEKEKLKDLEILQDIKEIEIQNKIIEKFGEF